MWKGVLALTAVCFSLAAQEEEGRKTVIDFTRALRLEDASAETLTAKNLNEWSVLEGLLRFTFHDGDASRAVWMGGTRERRALDVRALGFPVCEIQAGFRKDGTLGALEFILFSRGDLMRAKQLGRTAEIPGSARLIPAVHDERAFLKLCLEAEKALESALGKPKSRMERPQKGHEQRQFAWTKDGATVLFAIGRTEVTRNVFSGEYIRARLLPADPSQKQPGRFSASKPSNPFRTPARSTLRKSDLAKNVVRNENGLVFIDHIPMVDQGAKGYCGVATLERIVRYYGSEVSQHELAQLFGTGDGGGTPIWSNRVAPDSFCKKYGLKQEVLETPKLKFSSLAKRYNKTAAKKLPVSDSLPPEKLDELLDAADPQILLSVVPKTRECREFLKIVKRQVDRGIPLIWLVPGHLRLLIGYNERTGEIAFSDSWGAGHECNSMPLVKAVLLTNRLYTLQP